MKRRLAILFSLFTLFSSSLLEAQIAFNNGALVYAQKGTIVQINGGIQNDNTIAGPGTFTNDGDITITSKGSFPGDIQNTNNAVLQGSGKYHLDQDWINDATFIPDSSTVDMFGNLKELITSNNGTVSTFDTLLLRGTGTLMNRRKQLTLNANVAGALLLNDRVLFTVAYTLFITTPSLTAITNSTAYLSEGFVSSIGTGGLSRVTNSNSAYYFPVGADSVKLRYRKILLTPASANPNTYLVRLANNDATNDGDSIKFFDTVLCNVNPFFYHQINQTAGTDSTNVDIFYDASTDGVWTETAQWNTPTASVWNNLGAVACTKATPYSDVLKKKWANFSTNPFILGNITPKIKLTGTDSICKGDSTTLTATGGANYLWNTGSTADSIKVMPSATITYSLSVSNGSCIIDTIKTIKVNALPVAAISGISTLCAGDSTTLTANAGLSYAWSTGTTTASIKVSPISNTTYTLGITNGVCAKDTSVSVIVNANPIGTLTGNTSLCTGNNSTLLASGGTSYLWNTGATTNSITISPLINTTYTVVVLQNGCTDTLPVTVYVNPVPAVNACCDSSIMYGQNVQLTSSGGTTYNWLPASGLSCANCSNPSASPAITTTYTLTVNSDSGCSASTTITIDVSCGTVFVPEAFSPNGDGQNDNLYVRGDCIKTIDFAVFDRWGNKVFETTDKSIPWNGIYKGEPMNTGSYAYSLNAAMYDGTTIEKKGNVALVR